ncbi:uncharacterized protein MELLADRAFT_75553 [Melampsora larici-populina 98AG31]|uniref:Copper transport protein n=1 Tax=Melampsora larici-populina (strain 98AG31 / pathotype 3-4-7) TaxID=747676 RepID=F4S0G7_MELLP|nr:uncharacterized protein MELLADRAFT_75553 [Melampsora larici-populina 98AG31]EGG01871.1 hypothetical protein MELLADRAFT_75553 [Melampsora larici-populina 98AG31]
MLNESSNTSSVGPMSSTFSTSIPISPIWFQDWKPQTAAATFAVCFGLSILAFVYKSISFIKSKVLKPTHEELSTLDHQSRRRSRSRSKLDEDCDELINRSDTLNMEDGHSKFNNTPGSPPSDSQLHSDPNRSSETHDDFLDYPSRSSLQVESRSKLTSRPTHRFLLIFNKPNLLRCCLVTIQAGLGYLLMLAVMTYNIYYFMAILMGTFIGEAIFGQTDSSSHDHA